MKSKISKSLTLLILILCSFTAKSNPIADDEKQDSKELNDLNEFSKIQREKEFFSHAAANAKDFQDLPTNVFFPHDDRLSPILLDSNEVNLKYDVEVLESGDLKKENEAYEEQFRGPAALHLDTDNFSDEDIEVHALPRPEKVTYIGLFAGLTIFIVIGVIIYTVLVTWRRNLEQRYGARILIGTNCDDDDFSHQLNSGANGANVRQLPLNPV